MSGGHKQCNQSINQSNLMLTTDGHFNYIMLTLSQIGSEKISDDFLEQMFDRGH